MYDLFFSVGVPGCGNPSDQHALPGCPAWSHVLRRAQPRSFPSRGRGKEQVQHPHQEPLHLRYEKLAEALCSLKLCKLLVWSYHGRRTVSTSPQIDSLDAGGLWNVRLSLQGDFLLTILTTCRWISFAVKTKRLKIIIRKVTKQKE